MNKLSINYVVLSCEKDDKKITEELLWYLNKYKTGKDTLYLLYDGTEDNVPSIYKKYAQIFYHKLDHSYSEHRNFMLQFLKNDYSFFLDADEKPAKRLMYYIKDVIRDENEPDLLLLSRINIVEGLTQEAAKMYGWDVTDGNIIQWRNGDYQTRLFKNGIGLEWKGNLHERIITSSNHRIYKFDHHPDYAIIHRKSIDQQLRNNERYNQKYTDKENKGI